MDDALRARFIERQHVEAASAATKKHGRRPGDSLQPAVFEANERARRRGA